MRLHLILLHLVLLLGHARRVEELKERVARLLDLERAHLALLLLLLLNGAHGHVLAGLPLDLVADRLREALVLVVGVEEVRLCHHLVLEVVVGPEHEGQLEALLAAAELRRHLDVGQRLERLLVMLLHLLRRDHVILEDLEPEVGHTAVLAVDDVVPGLVERRLLLVILLLELRELLLKLLRDLVDIFLALLEALHARPHVRRQLGERRLAPIIGRHVEPLHALLQLRRDHAAALLARVFRHGARVNLLEVVVAVVAAAAAGRRRRKVKGEVARRRRRRRHGSIEGEGRRLPGIRWRGGRIEAERLVVGGARAAGFRIKGECRATGRTAAA